MRHYETAFLIAPNLPDEEVESLIDQMAAIVSKNKGKMEKIDNWGKKKTAYQIQKFSEAVYVFFHYIGEPDIPNELERQFKQKESVLRYLTLKKDMRENIRDRKKPAPRRDARRRPPEAKAEPPKSAAPITEAPVKEEVKAEPPKEAPSKSETKAKAVEEEKE